uniref:Shortage in chiasmata 1 n=1 Tax=Cairina moschata TaxID=8855 RepID=A0A8C3CBF6_CAIMO
MFTALKYHATDYLYESMARQKFSICRLSLCFPPCLQQHEKCHLTGLFADDKYRKPWTRVTSTQNTIAISVLDQWKKSLSVEDFLEKKPITSLEFHSNNELIEVVPSSNPCSQTDTEEFYLLKKNICTEGSTQDKYSKADFASELKEQWQDLHVEDELIFLDHLETYHKKLPHSSALLDRLKFFSVRDPLSDSGGQNLREENIFRELLTFQNEMEMQESKKESQAIKEMFCTITLKDEEYFVLPVELEFCKTSNSRSDSIKTPSYMELKELLNVAPETMADEDMCGEVIKEDIKAEISNKIEVSKYCPIPGELCSSNSTSMLESCESAKHVSYLQDEIEVPLTPLCRQQRSQVNFMCVGLQEEPIPLSDNSAFITEPSREYLECLVWQSEKYQDNVSSLLLVEHQTFKLAYQHHSLTELKKVLSIDIEAPMLTSLEEDWWIHMGLHPVCVDTLELLNMDSRNTSSLLPTEVETFTQFKSYQLERWLEEKNSMTNQELFSAKRHQLDQVTNGTLPINAASSIKIDSTSTPVEEFGGGSIQKSKVEEKIYFLNQGKKTLKSLEAVSPEDVSFKEDNSSEAQKPASFTHATKWDNDDSDLSNFIMLRSKHTITQREEEKYVDSPERVQQPKEQHLPDHKEEISVCEPVRAEKEKNESSITAEIQASESQYQAYCLLEGAAIPILKDLTHLGVLASISWSFDSIKFDHTRFFLKQQEKVICDRFKEGKVDEKEITLFRHAALVHLLVTVRDLLLTCGLDTALGYLSKAKDIYKNILESCLDNIWRQLKVVQYSSQKKHEISPKITELQRQMLNWMQSYGEERSAKILIITRMDSEREKAALVHTLSTVEGLKAIDLNYEKKGTFLGCKDVVSNLSRYSCVIVQNQRIGADFPWTHFSLVIEYDYSENSCWKNRCENLNITYVTFKTTLPETRQRGNHCGSFLLEVQIPYVFLTTEGLLNMPDFLQLLESNYSITFVERSCSHSLRLFGDTDRYVVLTIDERTAIFLQNMDELNYEKSCDNVILKLTALSLQYTCCWVVFYSRERLSLEYSLRGDTLLNLVIIYAMLTELTQKSEDFEVKVFLMPGIEEAALLIRQIADNVLMASSISPPEWLDKSWLSVLPSEMEKCLLAFPCINPLVAQFMLKKGSSLSRLFLASFVQLQELLPEVPKKVLKHFSDMTSSYSLNAAAPLKTAVKGASPPENCNNINRLYQDCKQNYQSLELLAKAQTSTGPPRVNSEAIVPPLNHHHGLVDSDLSSYMQKKPCSPEVVTGRKQNSFVVPKDSEGFTHPGAMNSFYVQRQPCRINCSSDHSSKNSEKEDFFATFIDCAPHKNSKGFLEEFRETTFKSPEIVIDEAPWNGFSSTCTYDSFAPNSFPCDSLADPDAPQSLHFHHLARESSGNRKQSPPYLWTKGKTLTDSGFEEVTGIKKRRLMYERVPGRSDGQTRLKFF